MAAPHGLASLSTAHSKRAVRPARPAWIVLAFVEHLCGTWGWQLGPNPNRTTPHIAAPRAATPIVLRPQLATPRLAGRHIVTNTTTLPPPHLARLQLTHAPHIAHRPGTLLSHIIAPAQRDLYSRPISRPISRPVRPVSTPIHN